MTGLEMAHRIAEETAKAGGTAYYVGGFVRDRLRGVESKDIDIEIHNIEPDTLAGILDGLGERTRVGAAFGIYGLRHYDIDIAMPRRERASGRGHRDFEIFVDPYIGTMKAAERRDFTINAMMENVLTGEIVDCFGGREDLKNGILRHVNDESFAEDPLRVLRAAQFAARFGFDIAPETVELCTGMELSALAAERVTGETEKALMKADKPSVFFMMLRKMNALDVWFPELKALIGVPQPPRFHPEGDVWEHTMLVLDEAAKLRQYADKPLWFMLSALCHDFGKAVSTSCENGTIHAYGHEKAGLVEAERFISRLTNERGLREYVLNMTENHMKPNRMAHDGSKSKSWNRMFDASVSPNDLLLLSKADYLGCMQKNFEPIEKLERERLDEYRELMKKPQVMGRDLIEAGLKPDKNFAELLQYAHKLALAGVDKELTLRQTLAMAEKYR